MSLSFRSTATPSYPRRGIWTLTAAGRALLALGDEAVRQADAHPPRRHEHGESQTRWKSHVRFGGRAGETHQPQGGRALRPDPYTQKVRDGGWVVNVSAVIATAVSFEGRREIIGFDIVTTPNTAPQASTGVWQHLSTLRRWPPNPESRR